MSTKNIGYTNTWRRLELLNMEYYAKDRVNALTTNNYVSTYYFDDIPGTTCSSPCGQLKIPNIIILDRKLFIYLQSLFSLH